MARSTRKSSVRGKSARRRPASTAKAVPAESPAEETDLDELDELPETDEPDAAEPSDGKDAADERSAKSSQGAKSAKDGPSRAGGKDPVSTKGAAGKKAGAKKAADTKTAGAKSSTDRPRGGEVAEKAKDSTRTGAKKAAAQESRRGPRRVATVTQNPRWLVPAALTFLLLGLCYLVTFYLTSGQLPLPIGDWNLAVGFGALMVGGGMFMFWK